MFRAGKEINLCVNGDCPRADCKEGDALAGRYRGCFFRRFQTREFPVKIGQSLAHNLLIARVLTAGQFPLHAGTRQFQVFFLAQSLDLFGAQMGLRRCFWLTGGGFDLGFDRLTFPASRHTFIVRLFARLCRETTKRCHAIAPVLAISLLE
jgi:hypothetical protein